VTFLLPSILWIPVNSARGAKFYDNSTTVYDGHFPVLFS